MDVVLWKSKNFTSVPGTTKNEYMGEGVGRDLMGQGLEVSTEVRFEQWKKPVV